MAQAPSSRSRLNLMCAICREVYRSPRLLPQCHHSFCVQCLEGMARNHGRFFPCPTCRTPVRVPEGGVQRFTVNFHIAEEDLEQERNQAFKPMCRIHPMEELIFFCKQCDQPICLRCRLTKHDHHLTEDLSEAADRCKKQLKSSRKRLRKSGRKLTYASTLLNHNRNAAKKKADLLREQILENCNSLITMVKKQCGRTLQGLTAVTAAIDSDFSTHTSTVQQRQDSLEQLQERVDQAIDSNNYAEVVEVEKEVREGEGSVEKLAETEKGLPTTAQRPGLQGGMPVLRPQDVARLLGTPVCLQLSNLPHEENITPVYRCEEVNGCREIHALQCNGYKDMLHIAYGGSPPFYEDERVITINVLAGETVGPATLTKTKVSFMGHKRFAACLSDRFTTERVIYSKSYRNTRVVLQSSPPKAFLKCSPISWDEKKEVIFELEDSSTPLAIDSNEDGAFLVVLSEEVCSARSDSAMTVPSSSAVTSPPDSASFPRRLVQMYLPKQTKPVSLYTPPQQPFFPTDVCLGGNAFCDENAKDVLVISDMANDSIHIVTIENNQFSFHRYVANGSPYILKPTALDVMNDCVYIGCQNGWVLSVFLEADDSEEEEMESEEQEEDEEEEEEDEVEEEEDTEQEEEEERSSVSNAGDSQQP